MTSKAQRPPAGEPWIWLTRDLINSDAWRSLGINAKRFVEYLMLEHMSKGGRENGKLKAPHRQIIEFGVCPRHTAAAIREAEELGIVDCTRGGVRVATTYALTWLPLHDGTPATNRWRSFRDPALKPTPAPKRKNLPEKGKAGLPEKVRADGPNLPEKGMADGPKNLPEKGKALSRKASYQGGADYSDLSAGDGAPQEPASGDRAAPGPASAANGAAEPVKQPWHIPVVIELPLNGRPVSPQETPHAVSPLPRPDKTQVSSHE